VLTNCSTSAPHSAPARRRPTAGWRQSGLPTRKRPLLLPWSCGINLRSMERLIVGLATTVLVSGGLGLAGLGLGVPTAQADEEWCPSMGLPRSAEPIDWDWSVCHNYVTVPVPGGQPVPRKIVEVPFAAPGTMETHWCPGMPVPSSNPPVAWDMSVCHGWHYASSADNPSGLQVVEGPGPARMCGLVPCGLFP
jgi:hypothetical protein